MARNGDFLFLRPRTSKSAQSNPTTTTLLPFFVPFCFCFLCKTGKSVHYMHIVHAVALAFCSHVSLLSLVVHHPPHGGHLARPQFVLPQHFLPFPSLLLSLLKSSSLLRDILDLVTHLVGSVSHGSAGLLEPGLGGLVGLDAWRKKECE